ncbi:MAG: glycogen synthase [Chloroflexi bacterium AL-W]|nr:glycogen synthase [Chloroflexi bacterium AL-N1]NOK69235.1 glycogen synthase [Chloroflexi bacterium AL-N10]NOK77218.1 glycogen synthase [Chloroflexi bacterium AL-N5]NOK83863.1 glycogen synthase [Chloroflexi bacterium AL-W]NOK91073.1 glycogen synthase [Chloroflexi bacterium AL-N15]
MTNAPLNILMMSAEMVPFAKTGGMADVVGVLPKVLKAQGHDVRITLPGYRRIHRGGFDWSPPLATYTVPMDGNPAQAAIIQTTIPTPAGNVPVYLIENDHYYNRDGIYMYEDDADRFIFFCRAVLEGMKELDWYPDIIHCHDWQTAIVPNWLKTIYKDDPFYTQTACIYTIHNLAYQGIFGHRVLEIAGVDEYGFIAHPDLPHLNDVVDFMGRGIFYADIVNTVSETYAREILEPEFGEGLDPILRDRRDRLYGILNGIDVELYNPKHDEYIADSYDIVDIAPKMACKVDLQRAAQLPQRPHIPLIGIISRLTDPKGFDLISSIIESLLQNHDVQMVVLGTGEQRYHDQFNTIQARFSQKMKLFFTFNAALAHKIYAGSDMFLMPSRFEPCGLGQMIALRYGSIPIVRETGGLADTVTNFDPATDIGNGFSFQPYDSMALYATLVRALETYRHPRVWKQLVLRAMSADHSWQTSARRYEDLYRRAMAVRSGQTAQETYQEDQDIR